MSYNWSFIPVPGNKGKAMRKEWISGPSFWHGKEKLSLGLFFPAGSGCKLTAPSYFARGSHILQADV